jgi:DNA polymerase III delta prime subunit
VPGSLDKKAEKDASLWLIKWRQLPHLFLSNEPGTGLLVDLIHFSQDPDHDL